MRQSWILLGLAGMASGLFGEQPSHRDEGYAAFSEGTFENVSLSAQGELRAASALREVAVLEEPVVWTALAHPEGGLVLGTGNRGRVYRMDEEGAVELLLDPGDLMTHALALEPDGAVLVGTSPNGRIYRVREGGDPELLFDPGERYIWQMALGASGELWVATGLRPALYRLAPGHGFGEELEPIFTAKGQHLTSLLIDGEGAYVGSGPRGALYRVDAAGAARAIFNAGAEEVRAMARGPENSLLLAVIRETAVPAGGGDGSSAAPNPEGAGSSGTGSLIRVESSGFAEEIFRTGKGSILSLLAQDVGWLAGSSDNGKLYEVRERGRFRLLQRAARGGEITALVKGEAGTYVVTSHPGAVYLLSDEASAQARYTSRVLDTKQFARYGNLELLGTGVEALAVETRTGNTEEPDETWTDWVAAPARGALREVLSAPGRYLQYRVGFLGAESPGVELRRVRAFVEYFNEAPRIDLVRLLPMGLVVRSQEQNPVPVADVTKLFTETPDNLFGERPARERIDRLPQDGYVSVVWRASDPNGDELRFAVDLRPLGSEDWLPLAVDIVASVYAINTQGLADGHYEVRLRATDARAHARGEGRTAWAVAPVFTVDNTPPKLTGSVEQAGEGWAVTVRGEDALSLIAAAHVVIDGGEPRRIEPEDGIFDAGSEAFVLEIEAGVRGVLVEVSDERGQSAVWSTRLSEVN